MFILVAELLGRGLKTLVSRGDIQPFSLPRGAPLVSHMSFADDFILFKLCGLLWVGFSHSWRHLRWFLDNVSTGQRVLFISLPNVLQLIKG